MVKNTVRRHCKYREKFLNMGLKPRRNLMEGRDWENDKTSYDKNSYNEGM